MHVRLTLAGWPRAFANCKTVFTQLRVLNFAIVRITAANLADAFPLREIHFQAEAGGIVPDINR